MTAAKHFPQETDDRASSSFGRPSTAIVISRLLLGTALLAQIAVAWKFWHLTWDDSAITLGFSRTFAMTGRVEPTPGSMIVEGYSSTLWMLLMAAAAKLVVTPQALLVVAKLTTLGLNLASILMTRYWLMSWNAELLANLVAGSVGVEWMFYETINGMETPLILFLVLVLLILLPKAGQRARIIYLGVGAAFVLVRWEAAWLLVPFILVERPWRRAWTTTLVWGSTFLATNLLRWLYFGAILPNSIVAKSGFPYSDPADVDELIGRLELPLQLLKSCAPTVLLTILCFALGRYLLKSMLLAPAAIRGLLQQWQLQFTLLFTLFSFVLVGAIGPNTGPPYRAFYSAWPFLFYILMFPIVTAFRAVVLTFATVVLSVLACKRMLGEIRDMRRSDAPVYQPETTVDAVAGMADVLETIRTASHARSLVYAAPDMGGVILFSEHVQIVDLGLLCDPVLARERYAVVGTYVLEKRHPDVIEVHDPWTRYTNLVAYPQFLLNYRPVVVDNVRLFLTNQLIGAIDPTRLQTAAFTSEGKLTSEDPPLDDPLDEEADKTLNRSFGTYLILQ